MLTSFDDYPIHQTSHPIARTASSDVDHEDRYFFNGYTRDTTLFFAASLTLHPNRHVADAGFGVVVGGGTLDAHQINVHASRRAPSERADAMHVGPIRIEVLEPLRSLRLSVEAPEHGLRAHLTFRARTSPIEEPHRSHHVGNHTSVDSTRMTQFGTWEGWIEIDGETTHLASGDVLGSRERSWGVRRLDEHEAAGAPVADPQHFWLWAPLNFEGFAIHADLNELSDGRRWHESGAVARAVDPGADLDATPEPAEPMRSVDVRLAWRRGTRSIESADLDLVPWNGEPSTITLEPLYDFHMLGVGSMHPEWGHGAWNGELAVGGERWDLPVDEPTAPHHVHVQTIVTATTSGGLGVHEGLGVLEQLVIGRHAPTGLEGRFDGFVPLD